MKFSRVLEVNIFVTNCIEKASIFYITLTLIVYQSNFHNNKGNYQPREREQNIQNREGKRCTFAVNQPSKTFSNKGVENQFSGIRMLLFDIAFPAVFTSLGLNRLAIHLSQKMLKNNSCRSRMSEIFLCVGSEHFCYKLHRKGIHILHYFNINCLSKQFP